jgi:hypothetical protein
MHVYNDFSELPNRRGEYLVNAKFLRDNETVRVHITFDVDEDSGIAITDRYGYFVESLDSNHVYASSWGFATISAMIPNIPAHLETIE